MEYLNREVTVTTQLGKKYQGVLANIAPDSSNFILRSVRIISPPSSETYDVLMFQTSACTKMAPVQQYVDPLQSIMNKDDSSKVADSAVIYSFQTEKPVYSRAQGIIQGMFASTSRRGQQQQHQQQNNNNNGSNNSNNQQQRHQNSNNNNNNKSYSNKRRANQQTQTPQPQHKNQQKNQNGNNKNNHSNNNNNGSNKGQNNNHSKDNNKKSPLSPSKSVRFQDQVKVAVIGRLPQVPAKFANDRHDNRHHNHNGNRRNNYNQNNGHRQPQHYNGRNNGGGRRHNGPRRDGRGLQIPRNGVLVPRIDAATGEAVKSAAIDDNFDFERAMELFNQLTTVDNNGETVDAEKENASMRPKDFYDRANSFYDKISSDATRELEAKRKDRSIEANRDMQTFGERAYKGYVRTNRRRTFSRRTGPHRKSFVVPRQIGTQDKADAEKKVPQDATEAKEVRVPETPAKTTEETSPAEVRATSPSPIPISTC